MLAGICLANGQPGPAVPPIIVHPGPALPNNQGGVVTNYYQQLNLYNKLMQIKKLANQVFDYAFSNQNLLLHLEDHTSTLNGETQDHFTYLWSSTPQEEQEDAINKNETKLKMDYNINKAPTSYFKQL